VSSRTWRSFQTIITADGFWTGFVIKSDDDVMMDGDLTADCRLDQPTGGTAHGGDTHQLDGISCTANSSGIGVRAEWRKWNVASGEYQTVR
jgi:hypothetical protein